MGIRMVVPGIYEFNPELEDDRDDFRRHEELLQWSGLPAHYIKNCRISNFEMLKGREEGFEAACRFIRGEIDPPTLLLYGEPGRSKTHLAAAIAVCAIARLDSVVFYHVGDLLDDLRAGMRLDRVMSPGEINAKSASSIIGRCKRVKLLVLDDMGLGSETEWAWEKLDTIVNHRHYERLGTVITANTLDISDRIRDRCREGYIAALEGESYRDIIARRKKGEGHELV